jgi:hypothetical protein
VDLTPSLIEASERDQVLPYNTIYDTHLNAAGSAIVARVLAEALGAAATKGPALPSTGVTPAAPQPGTD